MFSSGYVKLYVTKYNNVLQDWELKITDDYEGRKDEEKYFRVLREGQKYFYESVKEYENHSGYKVTTTVNDELDGVLV